MVRQKDIAEACGFTVQTVSLVLSGRYDSRYPAKTLARIRTAAEKMGYRPNAAARSVRAGRQGSIAIVQATDWNLGVLYRPLLDGICDGLDSRNSQLTLARIRQEQLFTRGTLPKLLREQSVDGLLLDVFNEVDTKLMRRVEESGVPALWLNTSFESDSLGFQDAEASADVLHRMAELGHRRVAYVDMVANPGAPPRHYSVAARVEGFLGAARERGIASTFWQGGGVPRHERISAAVQWLSGMIDRPTAVLCYHASTALALYIACQSLGIRVPQDLSLVAFSDEAALGPGWIDFSGPVNRWEALGRRAVDLLFKRIENHSVSVPSEKLPFDFHAGATLAPPVVAPTKRTSVRRGTGVSNRRSTPKVKA